MAGYPPNMPPNTPPNSPPGGPPYGGGPGPGQGGPVDPRTYWRWQREQAKAAARAQRAAWRAQRMMMRASRSPSVAGPILLIAIGVLGLLLVTGRIGWSQFWEWYRHWWPVLLIALGLVALGEWAMDLRRETPRMRRFGGFVFLVILLALIGVSSQGFEHVIGPLRANFDDSDDFFNALGQPEHDQEQAVLNAPMPADGQVEIDNPRGDVSLTVSDGSQVTVRSHQVAFASSDNDAQKIFKAEQASVKLSGNTLLVKVDGSNSGRTNLEVSVPRLANVTVINGHGGLTAAGLGGSVDATIAHGDLVASSIDGHVHAHIGSKGSFTAHDVKGDVSVTGGGNEVTATDVHGQMTIEGEYDDVHLERVGSLVHFHSLRTDMDLGRLSGDLSISPDEMHLTEVEGPIRVVTHSKDIEMTQVYGETHVEDRDGHVSVEMAGAYPVDIRNRKGDVDLALPPGANVTVSGQTRNGDIVSDFPLTISGDDDKTVVGSIGKGGPQVELYTEHADLHLRKGPVAPSMPPPMAPQLAPMSPSQLTTTPGAPAAPVPPGGVHLKAKKGEAAKEVSQ